MDILYLMFFTRKQIKIFILILFCIFISLCIFQLLFPLFSLFEINFELFRDNIENFESKNYMNDLSGQLCKIEDTIFCNTDFSDKEKFDKVYEYISNIPDSNTYNYKKDLQKIVYSKEKKEISDDYKSIFTSIMNKIKKDRKQMTNDMLNDSKSQVLSAQSNPVIVNASKEKVE